MAVFVVSVMLSGQVSYADKKINGDGSSVVAYKGNTKQVPIGNTGVSIATYVPVSYGKEGDIKVFMMGMNDPLAPEDMQNIAFRIENQLGKEFRLDNIFPKRLFVDDYVVQANNCEKLAHGDTCLFYINGKIIPLEDFSSKTYINIVFIDSNGQEDGRDIRPWSPMVLYPNVCDFSQEQKIYIKNVYRTNVEIIRIEEEINENRKIIHNGCKKLLSDQICEFNLPAANQLSNDVRRLIVTYKIGGQVQSDYFGVRSASSTSKYEVEDNEKEDAVVDNERKIPASPHAPYSSYGWHWIIPTFTTTVIGGALAIYFYVKGNVEHGHEGVDGNGGVVGGAVNGALGLGLGAVGAAFGGRGLPLGAPENPGVSSEVVVAAAAMPVNPVQDQPQVVPPQAPGVLPQAGVARVAPEEQGLSHMSRADRETVVAGTEYVGKCNQQKLDTRHRSSISSVQPRQLNSSQVDAKKKPGWRPWK